MKETTSFGIRPEDIHSEQIALEASPEATVRAEVVVSKLLGAETMLYTRVGATEFISKVDARDFHRPGETVDLAFNINKAHFFDKIRKCHHTSLICSYHALFSDLPPRQSHLTNIHFYSLFVSPKNRQSADCLFLGFVVFPTKRLVTNEKPEAV